MASGGEGFAFVHRRVLHHPMLRDPGTLGFWVQLILRAAWEDGHRIKRGELIFSGLDYCEQYGVTRKWVRSRLAAFEGEGMIRQRRTQRGVILTITNYDDWQTMNTHATGRANRGANRNRVKRANRNDAESRRNPDLFDGSEHDKGQQDLTEKGQQDFSPISEQDQQLNPENSDFRRANLSKEDNKPYTSYKDAPEPNRKPKPIPDEADVALYRSAREGISKKAGALVTRIKRIEGIDGAQAVVNAAMTKDEPMKYLAAATRRIEADAKSSNNPDRSPHGRKRPTVSEGVAAILGSEDEV